MQDEPHTEPKSKGIVQSSSARAAQPTPRLGQPSEYGPSWKGTQFRLSSLLVLITVIAAPMAWWGWHAMNTRRQQDVMEKLSSYGAQAGWLQGNVVQVSFRGERYDSKAIALLAGLPQLQRVVFMDTHVELEHLDQLADLPLDEIKVLRATRKASPPPDHKQGRLRLPLSLTSLWLEEAGVSDATLKRLPDLPQLQSLSLIGNPITDASVNFLAKRSALVDLYLERTSLTKEGADKLRRELPKAFIRF